MIETAKYYLGGYKSSLITSVDMYNYERKISGSSYYYGSNPNSWTGKLGLMYASDYGYASDVCETKALYNSSSSNDLRACNTTNWLYNIKVHEWLLPQYAGNSDGAFDVDAVGYASGYSVGNYQFVVRPVLYLTSSTKITGGTGTSTDPYTLGL